MNSTPPVETLCKWGKAKEVHTVRGPRILRTAAVTEDFWPVWNEHSATLKLLGLQVKRRMDDPNKWQVCWWQELPADVLAQREKLVEMSEATSAAVDIPKPEGLDYYPFQKAGVRYCLNAFAANGVLIGDEMGLGKTVQAIGVINATAEISRVLIICPLTLKANWERELSRWLVRPMTIGHARADFWPRDTDIVLCHYNILHRFTTRLANFWDLIVIDECHRIKNPKTRQTRCVVGYKPTRKEAAAGAVPTSGIPARRKLALSGTPFENRPAELWPVVSYIAPNLFSSRSAYERRYCGGGVDGGYYAANGATNLEELGQRLRGTCFVGNTVVDSQHGRIKIEDIERNLPMSVWTVDTMGVPALKPVVSVYRATPHEVLVEVRHANGFFRCTASHEVFTDTGYKRADRLTGDDHLLYLREAKCEDSYDGAGMLQARDQACVLESLRGGCESTRESREIQGAERAKEDASYSAGKGLRALRQTIYREERASRPQAEILHIQLSREAHVSCCGIQIARSSKKTSTENQSSKGQEGPSGKWSVQKTSNPILSRNALQASSERAYDADGCHEDSSGTWRLSDASWRQDDLRGHNLSGLEANCRGGWSYPCHETSKENGQRAGFFPCWSRVQSITRLELGDRGIAQRDDCEDSFVYDIEVADNHNYFANGCLVHNCMVRRLKRDVLKELPPKTRQVVEMDTDGLEDAIKSEQRVWHLHESDLAAAQVAMELAKASDTEAEFKAAVEALRTKTSLVFTELARVRHQTALKKLPRMIEMLAEEIDNLGSPKVVVFAHHVDVLQAAASAFKGSVLITGDTPHADRDAIVQRFQRDPNCGPFFGSIRATGEGITLTAASTVVFFENDWTASKMAQCSDRCHRIGQTDNVLVKYYILPGTVDAHMIATWIRKEEILEQALDSERVELATEATIMPKAEPIATRSELDVAATAITAEQRWAILMALRVLSGVCDGAQTVDGCGFSKLDVAVGKSLAAQNTLSPKQAALGQKLVAKYRRQLGTDTLTKCGIK